MMGEFDLLIIGAGPAGMSAAVAGAGMGLRVAVVDEQPAVGGQVFRAIESAGADPALRGAHADAGRKLAAQFHGSRGIQYFPRSTVWHIELAASGGDVSDPAVLSVLRDDVSQECTARRVLLATGGQERPMPVPGWTLPGVMTAGAAQILLKTAGAVPHGPTVIAGQGPLCWLVAVQLLRAGAKEVHFVETTPAGRIARACLAGGWWRGLPLLREGLGLMREARRRGLKVLRHAGGLRILGDEQVAGLSWEGGEIACRTVLLHDGVIPSTHISRALGLAHRWHEAQRYWAPAIDAWGAASHPQVAIAGDGGGVGGWQAAVAQGALAALDAAHRLGAIEAAQRDARASAPLKALSRALALRPFLDRLYAPLEHAAAELADDTVVCRCEEVTAGQIRAAVKLGAAGPNQIKAFLRAGMGPCQGRMCGTTVAALIAAERDVPAEEVDPLRPRAPFKPLTVGALIGQPAKSGRLHASDPIREELGHRDRAKCAAPRHAMNSSCP